MKKNNSCPCVTLEDVADFFELSQTSTHGVRVTGTCELCDDMSVWGWRHRSSITRALSRAITTLEKNLGRRLCPHQESSIVDPTECPLRMPKGAVMGVRELIDEYVVPVAYMHRTDCMWCDAEMDPNCPEMDLIGQVMVYLPPDWEFDMRNVEIDFGDSCPSHDICLPKPCYDLDCCAPQDPKCCPSHCCVEKHQVRKTFYDYDTSTKCESFVWLTTQEVLSYDVGTRVMLTCDHITHDICDVPLFGEIIAINEDDERKLHIRMETVVPEDITFGEITIPHLVATWDKWLLTRPDVNETAIWKKNKHHNEGMVQEVVVRFYNIDESQAVVPIKKCTCDTCVLCTCGPCGGKKTGDCGQPAPPNLPTYEWEYVEECLELCFKPMLNECSCMDPHKVKLNYYVYPDLDDDIRTAIILRAALWSPPVKCNCSTYDKLLEWWLELDPSTSGEAFATRKHYPYGKTRAGVELLRLLEGDQRQQERERNEEPRYGMFVARRVRQRRG